MREQREQKGSIIVTVDEASLVRLRTDFYNIKRQSKQTLSNAEQAIREIDKLLDAATDPKR